MTTTSTEIQNNGGWLDYAYNWRPPNVSYAAGWYDEPSPTGVSRLFGFFRGELPPYVPTQLESASATYGILESLKTTCLKGTDLVKQIETNRGLFGKSSLHGDSLRLYHILDELLESKTITTIDAFKPSDYYSKDSRLGITPSLSSHAASMICARFQGVKWSIKRSLLCELLSIEKELRKKVLEVLTAVPVTKRRPKYPILINRATAIRTRIATFIEFVTDRFKEEEVIVKAALNGIPKSERARRSSPKLTLEWRREFNGAFAIYEKNGKVDYSPRKT